jgi:hypothetical protein
MRNVITSQAAHKVSQSERVGTPNGPVSEGFEGVQVIGNVKAGLSNSHNEYWKAGSVQRWTGRRFASANKRYASASLYLEILSAALVQEIATIGYLVRNLDPD